MNLSEPFIRRPVMTTLSMLSILLFGIVAYRGLPVSDLPNVDFPTIFVSAELPGASPTTMASAVATPLEREFATIAGIDSMSSTSALGTTQITLQFNLSRNIDGAAQDVQAAISRALSRLPQNMPSPPTYRKVNPADQPIFYLSLTTPTLPVYQLDDYGETMLAQRISMVTGVAQVQVFGSQKYAVRVELDPTALASRGIGIDEVASAVQSQNVNTPLGVLDGPDKSFTIEDNGQLTAASAYMPLLVAYRNGQPVRLRDVGRAVDSVENDRVAAWYWSVDMAARRLGEERAAGRSELVRAPTMSEIRGYPMQRAIVLAVQRQPGTNTVQVARAINALLPRFREQLPASVTLHVLRDGSETIKASANEVQFTLLLTLVLVVLVIFLFLRNLSATVIPSLVLPMSIIGTFIVMYLFGYSLDVLSLMALTLSVGFVVDDAIVMLENIVRHLETGKSRMQAALDGSRQIGFTIVSMTLSLAAVFIPVLFMGGIVGRLFREFSVTIGSAVLVSGLVSLTLTPMLASRFLRDPARGRRSRAYRASEAVFGALLAAYGWCLRPVLRHRLATLLFSLAVLAATVWLFIIVPKGFIPSEDRDLILIQTETAQDSSFASLVAHQTRIAEIVRSDPDVDQFMCAVGASGISGASNIGRVFVMLRPLAERRAGVDEIIARLRPRLHAVPGVRCYLQNPPSIQVGGRLTTALYQLTLQGPDTDQLYRYAQDLQQRIQRLPGFVDVNTDVQLKNPQVRLRIDRDQARILGVTPAQIEDALYSAYGTRQISTILAPNNEYRVILELLPQYQTDPSALQLLYVRSTTGALVPLGAVTRAALDVGPLVINHSGQLPSATVSFNLQPGVPLGRALADIAALTRATAPAGVSTTFQGAAQAFQSSFAGMLLLLLLAVTVIYIVLGILYEHFLHPITILSALPFAGFGALLTLVVFRTELSIYSFVGIIMLVGLVKKNGIMMVDFAVQARRTEGKSAADAIYEACLVRFRPIMMTTVAALMAGLPIALGFGAGAEARRPLGLAVVGGLLFSQTLTLFVTPVFYLWMERIETLVRRRPTATEAAAVHRSEEP